VPLVFFPGCDWANLSSEAANQLPSSTRQPDNIVVLGSPELTAGIPGYGPLTVEQIHQWLSQDSIHEPLVFSLPLGLVDAAGLIMIPSDNQLSRAKIELGRQLFFDGRVSAFDTMACAKCHMPEQDYSVHGVIAETKLNPPVCFNRLFSSRQSWDGRHDSLEQQIESPIAGRVEMGTTPDSCVNRLKSIEGYRLQFEAIFGKLDFDAVSTALASFQCVGDRTLAMGLPAVIGAARKQGSGNSDGQRGRTFAQAARRSARQSDVGSRHSRRSIVL
jgi:cytochrome c peroxidase